MTRRALTVAVSLFVGWGAADLAAQPCGGDDAVRVFTEPNPPTNGAIVAHVDVPAGCRSVLVKIWGGGGNRYQGLGAAGGGGGAVVARISGLVGGTPDPLRRLRLHIAPRWSNYAFGGPAATVGRPLPGNTPPNPFVPLVIAGGGGAGGSFGPLAAGIPGAGGPGGDPGLPGEPAFAPNGATAQGGGGATGSAGGAGGVGPNNCVGDPGGPFQPYGSSQNSGGWGGGGVGGDGGDGWFGGGGGGCLGNASQSFGAGGGGGSNQIAKDTVYRVVGIESVSGAGREPARRDDPERSDPLGGMPACPECGYGVNAGASPTSERYGGRARIVLRFEALEILPATTRWKPQRDNTKDIQVRFAGPVDLDPSSVSLTVTPPAGGPLEYQPITEAVTKVPGTTDEYTFKWKGPWTFTENAQEKAMPRGNYSLSLSGRPLDSNVTLKSPPYDAVSLVEVTGIDMRPLLLSMPLVPNTGPGGGMAVFPEAATPGGSVGDRGKLRVTATIDPVIRDLAGQPGVTVHFRGYDVDDPSSDTEPIDLDGDETPFGVSDNRVTPRSGLLRLTATSEVPGDVMVEVGTTGATAETVFRAAPLPDASALQGDNHRVVASTSRPWLTQLRAFQPSPIGQIRHESGRLLFSDENAQVSPMATIWRRLNLEIDILDSEQVTQDDFDVTGNSTQLEPLKLTDAMAQFVASGSDHPYPGDWQGSELWATPLSSSVEVWTNSVTELLVQPPAALCSMAPEPPIPCAPGLPYRLRDDTWTDLTTDLPLGLMKSLLERAYVKAERSIDNATKVHPFQRNVDAPDLAALPRDLASSPSYWSVQVLRAFDGPIGERIGEPPWVGDNDPNLAEDGFVGLSYATGYPQPDPSQPVCAVNAETIADTAREGGLDWDLVGSTTAHEVLCHGLSLGHVDGTLCQASLLPPPEGESLPDSLVARLRKLRAPRLDEGPDSPSPWAALGGGTQSPDSRLVLRATSTRTRLLIGEPAVLSVRFEGASALYLSGLSSENKHLRALVDRGAGFTPYVPHVFVSPWSDPWKKPLEKLQTTVDFTLAYDEGMPGWLFDSPGTYRVMFEYQDTDVGRVRSNVVTLFVDAPTGAEAGVLRALDPLLLASSDPAPLHPSLRPLVEAHPSSIYLQRARLNDLLHRMLKASDAFDPEDPNAPRPDRASRATIARELRLRLLPTARELAAIASPFTADALELLAQLQQEAGDLDESKETLRQIVREFPERSVAMRARGKLTALDAIDSTGTRE